MPHQEILRQEIESYLEQHDWARAHSSLARLWQLERKAATAAYVLSCYERLRGQGLLVSSRVAFLRSMTIEPLMPILRATALVSGIDLTTYVGQFNAYAQEILDPASALYRFQPDIVVWAVQTRDLAFDLWERFADLSEAQLRTCCERIRGEIVCWVQSFRSRSNAHLLVHTFEKPVPSQGILDRQTDSSQLATIEYLNQELGRISREFTGVHVLDYDALVARHGRVRWHDEGKWLTMRMPFAADSVVPMVNEWMKFIHPLCGVSCKMLVVDLDNTLWGGVVGEDGLEGIKIGHEYPGASYRALQRAILDLYRRGVVLAICSKNNVADAMAVLEHHEGMLLRPEHFSAIRINWCDKAQNLREIAAELNIGTDAIAFLDDSPAEREWVRSELPEVKIIDLPDRAMGYAEALHDCPWFQRLSLSQEDRNRALLYQQQQQRLETARTSNSLEDFYWSLDQEVTVAPVMPETLARVAQLTQKTNQFNVTTCRYSEQQIQEFASTPGYCIYSVRVTDRFGDNGIVGVLITRRIGDVCEIDTFLLSCRVIGRTIETAVLGFLAEESKAEDVRLLRGWFIPTKKNAPVRNLYASHQFKLVKSRQGATLWHLDLSEGGIRCPQWIRLSIARQSLIPETARA
jgi:FkbH-like protein